MKRHLALLVILAMVPGSAWLPAARGQDYYSKTARRNPVTGRQEIVDVHVPHWTGPGQGGLMFDGPSGCLQAAAVGRSSPTGRLAYFNQYMNPWSGARYATATAYNPFTRRYQTQHRFLRPPEREAEAETPVSPAVTQSAAPQRGIRVINVAPLEKVEPPVETQSVGANLPVQTSPRRGVTIKVLDSALPTPPQAADGE